MVYAELNCQLLTTIPKLRCFWGVWLRFFSTTCVVHNYRGLWGLVVVKLVVVAQWQSTGYTSQVSGVRFQATASLFTFLYFISKISELSASLSFNLNAYKPCQLLYFGTQVTLPFISPCTVAGAALSTAFPVRTHQKTCKLRSIVFQPNFEPA